MKSKSLVVLMLIVLTSTSCISFNYFSTCKADVLPKFYVDDDYNSATPGWQVDHFNRIQDAINASSAGDRIVVYAGTYIERLTITHKLDLFGEDKNITFIDGGSTENVTTISAEYVNISHFTIRNCGNNPANSVIILNSGHAIITDNIITSTNGNHGIKINNCDSNIIYDNTIRNNRGNGIYLNQSDSNEITYNTITSNSNGLFLYASSSNTIQNNSMIKYNTVNGIFLNETSNSNTISDNNISSNTKNGVFLNDHCDYNTFSNNEIYSNTDSGIRLENSSYNNILNSTINKNNNYGLMIVGSGNLVRGNTINSNKEHGVFLFADDNNVISYNIISGNTKDGLSLSNSTLDSVHDNEISYNNEYGINLDFFTLSNTIYNNYFHDNTKNAMDKSINQNTWNIAKTLGTNKVGGPYLCGNYWDDFDEPQEGANDVDGDGIADNPYTIYASNIDDGPILDIIPPSMDTPQVSPSIQKIGSYTYIYVNITETNTEIKAVYLNITDPNRLTSNFSIIQNKTGNTYYCNKQFSPIGNFTFHIAAKDRRNWVDSSNVTFSINKGIPPTIVDNTPKTGFASKFFTFNATVTDDTDKAPQLTVKVQWSHGRKGENSSMHNTRGNFFENSSVKLDNSTEDLSYTIYASDYWGNSITTAEKTVTVIDNEPPSITVEKYGPSSDQMPNKYTFGATITDNTEVANVYIEYWYTGGKHITADMDKKGSNYYEKNIQLDRSVDRLYCIIDATDVYGNSNNTRKPFANAGGPYTGATAQPLTFEATDSFDLDGYITNYTWNFGDGTTGSGEKPKHTYSANGRYIISLTVTDNDGNKNSDCTYVTIIQSIIQKTTYLTMRDIEKNYSVSLVDLFYSYDANGDYIVDTFVDPNDVLKDVHGSGIDVDGNIVFLLSVDGSDKPAFMWNSTTDEVFPILYQEVTVNENDLTLDQENEKVTLGFSIDKTNWTWIDIDIEKFIGNYNPDSSYAITADNRIISPNMTWKKDNKIYVLDDSETTYAITFSNIYTRVEHPTFDPDYGSIIGENQKSITITYNVPVGITFAVFGSNQVQSDLVTSDNKVFTYTPPGYLQHDFYTFEINARALHGSSVDSSSVDYEFVPYMSPPPPPEQSFIEKNFWWIFLVCVMGVGGIFLLIFRLKEITLESYVYIKNKKVAPFFKPIIFGPLNIDVDDENVSKAEIYLNGKLKTTLTQAPYIWQLDEPAFSRQKIETKVYDQNGNANSSGQMTFFVFNRSKSFK